MSSRAKSAAKRLTVVALNSDSSHSQAHTQGDPIRFPVGTSESEEQVCSHIGPNTPLRKSTHRSGAPMGNLDMLKKQLQRELSSGYRDLKDFLPSSVYASIAGVDAERIRAYLAKTTCYSIANRCWSVLPRDTSAKTSFLEKELYKPFTKIISSILRNFGVDSARVQNTHDQFMTHLEDYLEVYVDDDDNEVKSKTAPDLCVMGTGNTFRPKVKGDTHPSYFRCVSPVEIKTTRMMKSLSFEDITLQVAVYARQCFTHQANRFLTCAVVATEERFHLFVFDRAGTMRTIAFNLHDEAATFVRVIIGISSFNSHNLSTFDPDIKFLGCNSDHLEMNLKDYISVGGNGRCSYQIVLNGKPFARKAIRGRGTRCWLGTIVPTNVHVTVKESWRSKDRKPEWELLLEAVGLDGVCQMVAYTDDETTSISKFRSIIIQDFEFAPGEMDRIFTRVVLEAYGPPIHYFETPLQVLYAFRDAVAGHRALWIKNILHRDVSIHNILIGKEDARAGNRGVLIDLDMAINVTAYTPSKNPRTGTRAFQSVITLRPDARMIPQDHRDDLESFYYVLLWICSLFISPRKLVNKAVLQDLEAPEDRSCADFKRSVLSGVRALMSPWFIDTVFMNLLKTLGKILDGWISDKIDALDDANAQFPSINEIRVAIGSRDHDLFIQKIDDTIEALLNDKNDFGNSTGVDLRGEETVDLNDDAIFAPVIDNQATISYGNTAGNKRERSSDPGDELEDHTKRAHFEDDVPSAGISHLQITDTGSSGDGA
ncbi:hypothetical protein D9619_012876 [Psilocybe cf. subviscida]|uniref:Protein kinase domain-containing protein n=1 Tax=Psilocybe cf. subviscida TaxID=2480587 RepID=A0A8H5BI66_9AGAR|nr:hypothetical protein D9619_012876 [Psilocybe cf. subviscida]